ncbi:GFA family protein [Aestuariirhabdus litorea]|uniref:GFA family protein n=1 Tax=Aestuariirhabdus litorea TaxID=2528527 RepID=A0A3P3VQG6_9GAMM|nr:GFA family protein [Aestuariirhabdus litorea]RRJ83063.1 GFA family protein [Aestuariirhabdus litorea]RWW93221.1 GFA family protein [Endozoicomonadaceae bacterium GTF-13]
MLRGSCLCKGVVYEVEQLDSAIQHCSCLSCQKAHSAAFNTAAAVEDRHFHWVQGQELLRSFESSAGKWRYFCGRCGSQLVARREGQPWVLRVASLDDDPGVRPVQRIWDSHRRPWLADSDELVGYPEWEPGH